jgi:uncharacterized repeat protein (TIGR03803 family)
VNAQQEKVLHSFMNNGVDGALPNTNLVFDKAGNLYGAADEGGRFNRGVVFELKASPEGVWSESILHNFGDGSRDGMNPYGNILLDASGNIYGTASYGGLNGGGTAFELIPQAAGGWGEVILHNFTTRGSDGEYPDTGLIADSQGNLYGGTLRGGLAANCGGFGCGIVFELVRDAGGKWTEKILHDFSGVNGDGNGPQYNLAFDPSGNLYGTTLSGGSFGGGMVFELTPTAKGLWVETKVHSFEGGSGDGYYPNAGLTLDASGNLYGTTSLGGAYNHGTVFKLMPGIGGEWATKVLYSFGASATDGVDPMAGVIFGAVGNLYGNTSGGGTSGYGTVFELAPNGDGTWTEIILHSFTGTDGNYPAASLAVDGRGNIYGTTEEGGTNLVGTVFEIIP